MLTLSAPQTRDRAIQSRVEFLISIVAQSGMRGNVFGHWIERCGRGVRVRPEERNKKDTRRAERKAKRKEGSESLLARE